MKLLLLLIMLLLPCITESRMLNPPPAEWDLASSPKYIEVKPQKPWSWDIHWLITYYSSLRWLDEKMVSRIIKCESWYHAWAKNKTSTAGWLGQFLIGTWNSSSKRYGRWGHDRFEVEASIAVMTAKIKTEGTWAWNASKRCRAR